MPPTRMVPFLTLSELRPRAWVTLSGCNFRCRGCFSFARRECGSPMTVGHLVELLEGAARPLYGRGPLEEVIITGGEPALDPEFLVDLVSSLRPMAAKVVVQTNASLVHPRLLDTLIGSGMGELICDLKAYDHRLHRWYTGHTNQDVLRNIQHACARTRVVVNTLYMPGLVEEGEVESIARFLADCHPVELEYRICPFESRLSPEPVCRDPSPDELRRAREAASRVLQGTVGSKSCLRGADEPTLSHWITVFPDGATLRRGMDSYRIGNEERFGSQGRGGGAPWKRRS